MGGLHLTRRRSKRWRSMKRRPQAVEHHSRLVNLYRQSRQREAPNVRNPFRKQTTLRPRRLRHVFVHLLKVALLDMLHLFSLAPMDMPLVIRGRYYRPSTYLLCMATTSPVHPVQCLQRMLQKPGPLIDHILKGRLGVIQRIPYHGSPNLRHCSQLQTT